MPKADKPRRIEQDVRSLFPETIPLGEVQGWVTAHAGEGCICPACSQYVKKWRKTVVSVSVASLINLVHAWRRLGEGAGVHRDDFLITPKDTNFSQLALWGLVVIEPNTDEHKRTSGVWRPTPLGIRFVEGRDTIPRYVVTLNNEVVGYEGDAIDVRQALGQRFDYAVLMDINRRGYRADARQLELKAAIARGVMRADEISVEWPPQSPPPPGALAVIVPRETLKGERP